MNERKILKLPHCVQIVVLRKFSSTLLWQKFRERNVFINEVTRELISRKNVSESEFFVFPHCVTLSTFFDRFLNSFTSSSQTFQTWIIHIFLNFHRWQRFSEFWKFREIMVLVFIFIFWTSLVPSVRKNSGNHVKIQEKSGNLGKSREISGKFRKSREASGKVGKLLQTFLWLLVKSSSSLESDSEELCLPLA